MRRFRFRLAGFEKLLAQREDTAKLRVAKAAAEHTRAVGLFDHLQRLLRGVREEQRLRRAQRALPPRDELAYRAYFDGMGHTLARQQAEVGRSAERREACQRGLRDAATRHRMIELLRERRQAEHRQEALHELARILDEAGLRQFLGRGPEGPSPAA